MLAPVVANPTSVSFRGLGREMCEEKKCAPWSVCWGGRLAGEPGFTAPPSPASHVALGDGDTLILQAMGVNCEGDK